MPSKKSHIRLYADECFPITSVTYLRSLGYSVIHAFDLKLTQKSDLTHLKISKKINRILITLDRDFLYYKKANLNQHPGVVVISLSAVTPNNVNKICKKILKNLNSDLAKDSIIKCTNSKIIKEKHGKVVFEKTF